ncbi:MAG: hypothetical protein DI626_09890 [Micavibrio aeruginosavorus]|uniref:Acyltransferase 3 domain-containing protein n=1 Tax=Micavibrio aeruginosavorus TaxID=349221 RepID=A0A2W4ZM64_9BACT|nr:MAG: hypothetical protein DI626_09890 [Micavibrio aeruginosavorus]
MTSRAPASLTSYDFLKCAALALMIIDHVGAFFYPEQEWFRVFGRFSAPIWLFLIGFARSRDLPPRLWAGVFILTAVSFTVGANLLPLTILVTIILCRLVIDPVMEWVRRKPVILYLMVTFLFFLTFPTFFFFEYGAVALLPVMAGYMTRNRAELPFGKDDIFRFSLIAGGAYAVMELVVFLNFSMTQKMVVGAGMMALFSALTMFRPLVFVRLTDVLPRTLVCLIQIGGRWTLEIYIFHLVVFRILSPLARGEAIPFFTLHLFS